MVSIKAYVTVDTTPSAMSKYLSANAVSCVAVILLQSWSPSRRVVYVDYCIVGKKKLRDATSIACTVEIVATRGKKQRKYQKATNDHATAMERCQKVKECSSSSSHVPC